MEPVVYCWLLGTAASPWGSHWAATWVLSAEQVEWVTWVLA